MAWEENSRICLHTQLIAILSRIGVAIGHLALNTITSEFYNFFKFFDFFKQCIKNLNITAKRTKISE